MTAAAELGGYVDGPTTALAAQEPIDTDDARMSVVNNARHAYDCVAQTRVSWVARSADYIEEASPSTTLQWLAGFGPFPVTIAADGRPAPLVVALACATSVGGQVVEFVSAIRAVPGSRAPDTSSEDASSASTALVLNRWLALGALRMSTEDLETATRHVFAQDAPSGAVRPVQACLAYLDVYTRRTSGTGLPRLCGAYVREYMEG